MDSENSLAGAHVVSSRTYFEIKWNSKGLCEHSIYNKGTPKDRLQ